MSESPASLKHYLRGHSGIALLTLVLIAVPVTVNLLLPFLVRYAIDDLNAGQLEAARLWRYCALYVGGAAVSSVLSLFMRRIPLRLSHRIECAIRRDLFAHLTRQDPAFFQRERTGDIMTRMSSDLSNLRMFIGEGFLQGARTILVCLIAFTIMFTISVRLALVMLVLMPGISLTMFVLLRMIRPRYEARQQQFSTLTNFTQEQFAGIRTVKGFALEERRLASFADINRDFIRSNLRLSLAERPIWPLMMFLFSVGSVLILVVGGQLVIRGELTLGQLVQFNQYMLYLTWPVIAMGWTMNLFVRGMSSWKRIRELFDTTPAICDGTQTKENPVQGPIEFRHISLAMNGRPLLDDINLTIPEGKTVGITGPTGSGKTLLVSLMARLVEPNEGQVFIGVHDIRDLPLAALRHAIGLAPQEPFLFSNTIAHNVAFGLEDEDRATVEWAAGVAQLTGEVEQFPNGFQTVVGERGVTLSGGQRQRTAISRAIARNPEILILDDVLSAVDTQTEARILAGLREVLHERTSVLISHRVSTLLQADLIVVLENGRITQRGTHAELIEQDGYYQELDDMQRLEARLEAHE